MTRLRAMPLAMPLAALLALGLAACGGRGPERAGAKAADVDTFVRAVGGHPEPFHHVPEQEWRARAESLRSEAGTAPYERVLVELARLAALGEKDGHGGVFPYDQPGLETWPVRLYPFDDGLRLVTPVPGVGAGARLVRVGGRPVADVVRALEPLVPHDNAQTLRVRLPAYLVVPAFLRGLGIPVDTLGWERPDGSQADLPPPAPVPVADWARTVRAFAPQVPPSLADDPRLLTLRRRGEAHWWQPYRGGAYVALHRVTEADDDGATLATLIGEVRAHLRARPGGRLVLDLRHNPGGEVEAGTDLVTLLRERAAAYPGTVFALTGPATYSAAALLAADLAAAPGVTLLGEPTGGSADPIADPVRYDLAALRVVVHVSSRHYPAARPAAAVAPDRRVPWPWADYAAGRDPVLAAAFPA